MKIADDTFLGNSECEWVKSYRFMLVLAYMNHIIKDHILLSKMEVNELKPSNFKVGGTPLEPWCTFQFTLHRDGGCFYRKGK